MILCVTMNASVDRLYRVDALARGRVNRVRACVPTAGGKGLNVARVLACLSGRPLATGVIAGYQGDWLARALDGAGIAHDFLRVAGETRTCVNVIEDDGRQTELLEPGPALDAAQEAAFLQKFDTLLPRARIAVLSGSLPAGCAADLYARMIARCRAAGVRVLLDTSGAPLVLGAAARPDLVKPNEQELPLLLGGAPQGDGELAAAALRLRESGIGCAVISLGARGALMACAQGVFRALPPPVTAVNTTGCGDAMVAGFALSMARNDTPEQALAYATAVAASNAKCLETGRADPEELPLLLARVRVERLA